MNFILHLGLGSFHRAHQAVYVHALRQQGTTDDRDWAIAGGNLRPDMADTIAALQAQGGRYTLETVTPQGDRSYTVIESIQRVIPYQDDLAPLIAMGADPSTRIISFTVTEAGYYLDAHNQLDWPTFADLRADLGAGDAFSGPAIVEEFGSTIPVHPGFEVVVDDWANLVIRKTQEGVR